MCGRSRCSLAPHQVTAAAKVPEERWRNREAYTPSHNVAPGHNTPVVKRDNTQELEVHTMKYADCCTTVVQPLKRTHLSGSQSDRDRSVVRWGLVPSFTRKDTEKVDHFRMVRLTIIYNCAQHLLCGAPSAYSPTCM